MARLARTMLGMSAALAFATASARAEEPMPPELAAYFKAEVERIAALPLLGVESAEEWRAKRPEHQRQLMDMLGLDPLPPRTALKAEVRGVVERPDFVVERLVFQSSPGLYVTGNLYRPKVVEKPLPAILYVCGHARVEEKGVIYGNKTHYQHHAAWFAANGYVCLVLDTLQLGEVPGEHHGTYTMGRWWWLSRGYTPAGVEVWNGIRALDYLCSRPEVDSTRLGVTGRSGGGAMSWYLGAVDDRLKVVVPVAGITDLHDHVVAGNPKVDFPDGVVDGHCDCMYFINTYRWDHTVLAALVAPKALLVANTDLDPIFPEAGVRRIYGQLEKVYGWYGDRGKLDLVVGRGGHKDTEEIRHPAFAWFEKWLKGDPALALADIKEPDRAVPKEELKVLDPAKPLPANVNDTVDESFISRPPAPRDLSGLEPAEAADGWELMRKGWEFDVKAKVFAGIPSRGESAFVVDRPYAALSDGGSTDIVKEGLGVTAYDYSPEGRPELKRRVWMFHDPGRSKPAAGVELLVMGPEEWAKLGPLIDAFEQDGGEPAKHPEFAAIKAKAAAGVRAAFVAPLGVGRSAWPASRDLGIRRRFMLLGQTLDAYRVLEVVGALHCLEPTDGGPTTLIGRGDWAAVALWGAFLSGGVDKLVLVSPPSTVRDGPAFLNLDRILDMPQAVALLYPAEVRIEGSPAVDWSWTRTLARALGSQKPWPEIAP